MRKNICALFVVLLILLMMGCAATTKDAVDVEIKNDSTEVSVDSENETTESSTTEKETVDENTDTPENTEDNKEESEQEPELSEEEKHAALLEKINTQQETCKMLNDMNMGNKYSCFYDESTNTFTYNMDVSGAADFVPSDAFNDLINSTDFSASSNHEYLGIDCYSNFSSYIKQNSSLIATVISFRSIRILDFPSQSFVHVPNKISIPIQALNL